MPGYRNGFNSMKIVSIHLKDVKGTPDVAWSDVKI